MPWYDYFWTEGVLEHIAEHGVAQEDFEQIINHSDSEEASRSNEDRFVSWGYTEDGRYVMCVYERLDDGITVIPVTAYETPEPRGES